MYQGKENGTKGKELCIRPSFRTVISKEMSNAEHRCIHCVALNNTLLETWYEIQYSEDMTEKRTLEPDHWQKKFGYSSS